ncbi:MAG: aminoacylase [Gemmatimonadales bacterium]|nr:MAG: aminoacylase [Gemmatimonadales bacterium]
MNRKLIVLAACWLAACAPRRPEAPAPLEAPFDVVITGGRIVDGTGSAWFYGDLAIKGDRIARITPKGMLRDAPARERIDASGLVVAPGFIDIQSHSRGAFLFGDGRVVSKVTQGITTEIMGEGSTNAPLNPAMAGDLSRLPPERRRVVESFMGPHGFSAWLEAMERNGVSPNIGSFVGASTIRQYVKGMAMGPASPAELDTMTALVRRAMEDGAFGLASALIYPPGNFASTEELVELARAMAPYGGVYITHMRSEADRLLEAIDEAIEIGRRGGVPVEIYHLKAAGRRNWHKAVQAIAKIDSARAAGIDVQANMYPYVAGSTGLSACLPPWASADGKLLDNLRDPEMRERIRAEVLQQTTDWENLCTLATPEGVLILGLERPENRQYVGKRLSEIAEAQGKDWLDAVMDLILSEQGGIGTVYFMMSEENVKLQLRQPWIKFGTDAGGVDPDSSRDLTHPRAYGTFTRILGKYVREEKVLGLEDAIRKMTSAVATRLSIPDRGLLRPGFYADIVVFDPETVADRATFEQPHQLSVGVRHVFVNGVAVVKDGKHTGAKPGRVIRGPGYRPASRR